MLSTLLVAIAEEEPAPLIAPPWVFALIAAAVFIVLAFVTYSYRDVSNRHADKVAAHDDAHGHGGGHH
ncbi:hypothetical protein [Protaetiibacter mangrovi]|uniref:Uncharacterized protein n=1 Tax=Protaetiibacter mangrovi TaxID=2970926 RepID=A0ABT1ZES4_9MICO|nr:hypothetical protein [Protaetiibacter mangrovi]MCS0499165.1 hypothetical protein [Protaetiibacter mangrovi]TPW91450.1 hypothetical protein FJ656_35860 [Schumannella luteola]